MAVSTDKLIAEYLLPFVAGGTVSVGRPLDAEDLATLRRLLLEQDAAQDALVAAIRARLDFLWPDRVVVELDDDIATIAVAAYNMLFLSHPTTRRWRESQRKTQRLRDFVAGCLEGLILPDSFDRLLVRHVLVERLFAVSRTDVEVRFWAGRRVFQGAEPPRRLVMWPALRAVRREERTIRWAEELGQRPQIQLLERLLVHSPISQLLCLPRSNLPVDWQACYPLLYDQRFARLMIHQAASETGREQLAQLVDGFWRFVALPSRLRRRFSAAVRERLIALTGLTFAENRAAEVVDLGTVHGFPIRLALGFFQSVAHYLALAGASATDEVGTSCLGELLLIGADCGELVSGPALGPTAELLEQILSRAAAVVAMERREELRRSLRRALDGDSSPLLDGDAVAR